MALGVPVTLARREPHPGDLLREKDPGQLVGFPGRSVHLRRRVRVATR